MMKIGIVGSNSFLARNFCKYLVEKKLVLPKCFLLYDIQENSVDENYSISYRKIDLLSKEEVKKIDLNCDALFLFTGKTGTLEGFENYEDFININEVVLLNILDHMKNSNSKVKLIYPSTRLVYEGDLEKASSEQESKELKSIYSITKFAAEQYIQLYHKVFDLNFSILRICTPWGSLMEDSGHYGTFKFFIEVAKKGNEIMVYGDGSIRKTYTYIADICEVLYHSIINDKLVNDVYNIGGKTKSLQEIALMIAKKYGVKVKNIEWPNLAKAVDGGSLVMDSTKLDKILKIEYNDITFD